MRLEPDLRPPKSTATLTNLNTLIMIKSRHNTSALENMGALASHQRLGIHRNKPRTEVTSEKLKARQTEQWQSHPMRCHVHESSPSHPRDRPLDNHTSRETLSSNGCTVQNKSHHSPSCATTQYPSVCVVNISGFCTHVCTQRYPRCFHKQRYTTTILDSWICICKH